jgi:hypothetical protein
MNDREATELNLLKEFYSCWKWLHQQSASRTQKEKAAQALADAAEAIEANRHVVGRTPLFLAIQREQ